MPGIMRLTIKEATCLAEKIEDSGGDAGKLRGVIIESTGTKKTGAKTDDVSAEEYVELMRGQAYIENGEDLECCVCHSHFQELICDTCENCFREWVLACKKD